VKAVQARERFIFPYIQVGGVCNYRQGGEVGKRRVLIELYATRVHKVVHAGECNQICVVADVRNVVNVPQPVQTAKVR
jgi:hypothetical protein